MRHLNCPICGFAEMPYPPVPYNVCPCCGTEFGVADYYHPQQELRHEWITSGMHWFSDIRKPPVNWNPSEQLMTLNEKLIQPSAQTATTDSRSVLITGYLTRPDQVRVSGITAEFFGSLTDLARAYPVSS